MHCLAGENGSGKSTLIKIITGVYTPDPGAEMDYFGSHVDSVTPVTARGFGISVIWQDLALFPQMTVAENIAFSDILGTRPRLVRRRAMREKAKRVLARLGVTLDLDAPLNTLSIAERQIVAICRTLVGDARLIFMDEPTASLTHSETDSLLAIVREALRRRRVGGLRQPPAGRGAQDLVARHRAARRQEGRGLRHRRHDPVPPDRADDRPDLRQRRSSAATVPARGRCSRSPASRGEGEYEDIDLTIHAGEVVGLTGLIGAGRTELGLSLFGMTRPDRGTIRLNGQPIAFRSNRDAIAPASPMSPRTG